jgi:tetratricopeptide (TPR) repeat protein
LEEIMPDPKARRRKVTRKARRPAEDDRSQPGAEAEKEDRGAGNGARAAGNEWADLADRAARKVKEIADKARPAAEKMAVDLSGGLEEAFGTVSQQARDLMSKGQHTRVRIKFRGKQIAEVPIAVVAAAEVASFWWFGPLRVVLGHVVGKAVLDVEFVSNADHHVAEGRKCLADGELDKAVAAFDKALAMDRRHAAALLGKGIALKLRGDKAAARDFFKKAEDADPRSEAGREARRHLDNLS